MSADRTVTQLTALDPNLVNMASVGANSLVHLVTLGATSEAIPIFRDPTAPTLVAGFRLQKEGDGTFIYVAGRPYRYDTGASYQNYNYMLDNWTGGLTGDRRPARRPGPAVRRWPRTSPTRSTRARRSASRWRTRDTCRSKVYDAAGRHVRTLVDDTRAASEYTVTWNGKDDAGAAVAAGVYLYKLQTRTATPRPSAWFW